jgi:hypothetical protein
MVRSRRGSSGRAGGGGGVVVGVGVSGERKAKGEVLSLAISERHKRRTWHVMLTSATCDSGNQTYRPHSGLTSLSLAFKVSVTGSSGCT